MELEFHSLIKKEGNTQYSVLTASRSRSMIVSSSSKWRSLISSFFIWVSTSRATRLLIFRSSTWAKCFKKKKQNRIIGSIRQSEQEYQTSNFELQRGIEGLSSVINLLPEKLIDSYDQIRVNGVREPIQGGLHTRNHLTPEAWARSITLATGCKH